MESGAWHQTNSKEKCTLAYHRWHCFVGRNFGCFVTHEASRFVYFYIGQVGVCLFATA